MSIEQIMYICADSSKMLCVLFGSCGPMISCLEHFERVMCSKAFKKAHCYSHQHTSMMLEQTTTTPALRYVSYSLQMPNNMLEGEYCRNFEILRGPQMKVIMCSWFLNSIHCAGESTILDRQNPLQGEDRQGWVAGLWCYQLFEDFWPSACQSTSYCQKRLEGLLEAHCFFITPERSLTASGPGIYIYISEPPCHCIKLHTNNTQLS